MNVKKLKVGNVIFNAKSKKYSHIKEITKCGRGSSQYFVCGGECEFLEDSKTTIERHVIYWTNLHKYLYVDKIGNNQR